MAALRAGPAGGAPRALEFCRRRCLQAHVAAYRLSLAGAAGMANPFSEVRGGLVIEWRLACDGWLSRQRLAFVGTLQEGGDRATMCASAAGGAGRRADARFYRSYGNDELQEEFRGEAVLEPSEGGVATFTTPSERRIDLPAGTMFPTVHIQEVLRGRAPASGSSVTRCSMAPGSIC